MAFKRYYEYEDAVETFERSQKNLAIMQMISRYLEQRGYDMSGTSIEHHCIGWVLILARNSANNNPLVYASYARCLNTIRIQDSVGRQEDVMLNEGIETISGHIIDICQRWRHFPAWGKGIGNLDRKPKK